MTAEEIKSIIHESIENIDDEKFLEAIKILLEPKYKSLPALKISEKQKGILSESEQQIDRGEFYTNEEVKKISKEWLKD